MRAKPDFEIAVCFFFCTALCQNLLGQGNANPDGSKKGRESYITIAEGITDFHVKDENASPLIYRGIGLAFSVLYMNEGKKSKHLAELDVFYGTLGTYYDEYSAMTGRASFRYNYLHRIIGVRMFGNNLIIYGGGGLSSFFEGSKYEGFAESEYFTLTRSWYMSHSAELAILLRYGKRDVHHIETLINFPLISNVSRPEYTVGKTSEGKVNVVKPFGDFSPLWKGMMLHLRITYENKINSWLGVSFQYEFQYSSYDKPRRIAMFMNNLRVGTYFSL